MLFEINKPYALKVALKCVISTPGEKISCYSSEISPGVEMTAIINEV